MNSIVVKYIAKKGAVVPSYATDGAAGADVHAFLETKIVIPPQERALVPTGIFMEIPVGYEVQVRPRSGLAIKQGITCLNSPGTIDCDYRGEVMVILVNHGNSDFTVNNGDRIAQLVLAPVYQACFVTSEVLSDTDRSKGGFGSTGV